VHGGVNLLATILSSLRIQHISPHHDSQEHHSLQQYLYSHKGFSKMRSKSLLIINPNTTQSMTKSIDKIVDNLQQEGTTSTSVKTYTATSGVTSINNEDDALASAKVVFEDLKDEFTKYDAILVACYSAHPLVGMLQDNLPPHIHVTGILEASISTALSLLPSRSEGSQKSNVQKKFGIVSTGTYWEKALSDAVQSYLDLADVKASGRFKGVETTGLNADELHSASPDLVRQRMIEATARLVRDREIKVVCLGCAGMAGLDSIVEEALVQELGAEPAMEVHVLDGVKAGIVVLEGLMRAVPRKNRVENAVS